MATKYDSIDLDEVERLAGLGFIDVEIANILKISERSFHYYKKKPDFLQSLKRGKDSADEKVVSALFKNATDSGIVTLAKQKVLANGQIVDYFEQVNVKADTMAQMYWLNNRRKTDWRQKSEESTALTDTEINKLRQLANTEANNNM